MKVIVGTVLGAHGVRGEVVVRVGREGSVLETARRVFLSGREVCVDRARAAGPGRVILQIRDVADRDVAQALRGSVVEVTREALPATAADEFYWCDLVGLEVVTEDGRNVGVVKEVIETGANDVFVVQTIVGGELMVPAIPDVVVEIDVRARTMRIRPVPGLLDG